MEANPIYTILIAVLSGEATEEEKQILESWLQASEENRLEFEEYKRLYRFASTRTSTPVYNQEKAWEKVKKKTSVRFRLPANRWWKYVAAIAVLIVSVTCFFLIPSGESFPVAAILVDDFDQPTLLLGDGEQVVLKKEAFSIQQEDITIKNEESETLIYKKEKRETTKKERLNSLVVPRGTQYKVVLSDGTKVSLNSGSVLVYPTHFTGNKREVTLQGEGYFEVTTNPEKPFYVRSEHLDIRVTGTVFNFSCYPEDRLVDAVLIEGKITVISENGAETPVSPSQLFSLNKENAHTSVSNVNPYNYISWMENRYVFRNTPLQDIMIRLQRWHDFTYSYEDESLKDICFSIPIDRYTALEQLLEVINFTSDIQLTKNNNTIYVKRKEVK